MDSEYSESSEGPKEGEACLRCPACGEWIGYEGFLDDSYKSGDDVEGEDAINEMWERKLVALESAPLKKRKSQLEKWTSGVYLVDEDMSQKMDLD